MAETPSHDEQPASTADLLRRVADHVEHPTPESLNVDVAHLFEWASDLERRVRELASVVEVVTAIRADVAAIAEGIDPTLTGRVAHHDTAIDGLLEAVGQHRLLLARLLDDKGGE